MKQTEVAGGSSAVGGSPNRLARLMHDIKDHNNSILLGTDLLHKYWDDLRPYLVQPESYEDSEVREALREVMQNIPLVISGIRKASGRIEEVISVHAEEALVSAAPSLRLETGAAQTSPRAAITA